MSSANVKSIPALDEVKASLATFSQQCKDALTEVELEIRRTMEWICTEQPQFWQRQIRERGERVSQAKVDLMRCRMFRVTDDHVPDCMEQKIALRKAERQLEEAEEKLKKTREWARQLPTMIDEYLSQAQQLCGHLDGDLAKAAASLERMAESLESYTMLAPPNTALAGTTDAATAGGEPMKESPMAPGLATQVRPADRAAGDGELRAEQRDGNEPDTETALPAFDLSREE